MGTVSTAQLFKGRSALLSDDKLIVDATTGTIKNVSLITIGEAQGHGFWIDETTLDQMLALASKEPNGIKSRFKHPGTSTDVNEDGDTIQTIADDIGSVVGRVKNIRKEDGRLRGDIVFGQYASNLPVLGDVKSYLLSMAQDDPTALGMSAVFEYKTDVSEEDNKPYARPTALFSVDFVGTPAANSSGLLAAKIKESKTVRISDLVASGVKPFAALAQLNSTIKSNKGKRSASKGLAVVI